MKQESQPNLASGQGLGTFEQAERIEMGSAPGHGTRGSGHERPLDDLLREAKEKAAERNIGRIRAPRIQHRDREMGR